MNESYDQRIQNLLKASLPPAGHAELQRDLWPAMLQRIESAGDRSARFAAWDWAIAGLVAASVVIFPGLIPGLLYHL